MYAIIEDRGMQYKVAEGESVDIDLLQAEPGEPISFDRVLLVSTEEGAAVGTPTVDGASVAGEVLGVTKAAKIVVQRFRRRQGSHRRKIGHRQRYTSVRIQQIVAPGRSTPKDEEVEAEQGGTSDGA